MACLGSVLYDPTGGAIVSKATSSLLAMTALDTTNARITFTAPANGTVLARIRATVKGAAGTPRFLFGVMDGSTVKARSAPICPIRSGGTTSLRTYESVMIISGLTPSASLTYDAAYCVEALVASTAIVYGGPDSATANNAGGALSFEIWETENLLAGTLYDPGTAASKSVGTAQVMTAMDTTNLRLTPTIPASGRVVVQIRGGVVTGGTSNAPGMLLGVLAGSTVRMRQAAMCDYSEGGTVVAASWIPFEAVAVLGGLTPGSATWDLAWGVEQIQASANIRYGGPNNASADDAYGGIGFYVWSA